MYTRLACPQPYIIYYQAGSTPSSAGQGEWGRHRLPRKSPGTQCMKSERNSQEMSWQVGWRAEQTSQTSQLGCRLGGSGALRGLMNSSGPHGTDRLKERGMETVSQLLLFNVKSTDTDTSGRSNAERLQMAFDHMSMNTVCIIVLAFIIPKLEVQESLCW